MKREDVLEYKTGEIIWRNDICEGDEIALATQFYLSGGCLVGITIELGMMLVIALADDKYYVLTAECA